MQAQLACVRTPLGGRTAFARRATVQPRRASSALAVVAVKEGDTVKVTRPIVVYHVGKFKDGLNLEGREGVVVENVMNYKGQELSANLPWKVQFLVDGPEGKPVKVLAHLVRAPLLPPLTLRRRARWCAAIGRNRRAWAERRRGRACCPRRPVPPTAPLQEDDDFTA
jgi:hypothetical protein